MQKRYVSRVLCLFLPVMILSGCGMPVLSGNTEKDRTLIFSHWDVDNQKVYESLAEAYSKEHKGLTIKVQSVEQKQYSATWLRSASDKTADVFAVPTDKYFQDFIDSGRLKDLSKSDILPDYYDNDLVQIGSRNGHTWAVPISGSIPVVFFNKAYYQQSKLVSPLTASDFIVNCSILKQNGLMPFAMSKDDNGLYDTADFVEGIIANGPRDTPLMSSGKFFDKNTELDSGFTHVMGLAHELTTSDLLVTKENSVKGHQALLEQFAKGAYAMIPGDTNDIKRLRALDGNFSFGFFPMPDTDASFAGVFKAGMMLGISKSSKVSPDAEGFISYLLSPSSQELLCNATLSIPVSYSVNLSDADLAKAQTFLGTSDVKRLSLFQRITNEEKSICLKRLDLAYNKSAADLNAFILDWADELKAASKGKK